MRCNVIMEICPGELEFRVIERAVGIIECAQPCGDVGRELNSPDNRGAPLRCGDPKTRGLGHVEDLDTGGACVGGGMREPDAAGAKAGGVVGPGEVGSGGYKFEQASGSESALSQQPSEVVKSVMKRGRQAQPRTLSRVDGGLEVAEEAPGTRQSESHGAKLAEELMPRA